MKEVEDKKKKKKIDYKMNRKVKWMRRRKGRNVEGIGE